MSIRKWNEIAIEEIAALTCAAKPAEMKSREAAIERLQNWLLEVEDSLKVILAI